MFATCHAPPDLCPISSELPHRHSSFFCLIAHCVHAIVTQHAKQLTPSPCVRLVNGSLPSRLLPSRAELSQEQQEWHGRLARHFCSTIDGRDARPTLT